jgi:poly-gamma-glutamate synthesis protein (capsule biosynthesis protein)
MDPVLIEDVREMGFHAVSLANNHMLDYGRLALFDTLEACDQAGVLRTGAGANLAEALEPVWFQVGGKRVAFISVSCTLPPGSEATEDTAGMVPIRILVSLEVDVNLFSEQPGTMPTVRSWTRKDDEAVVLDHIRTLRRTADLVIVAVHWGAPAHWLSPFQGRMIEYQQPLGRAFVEAGADVVFGHHSHALNGIEVYHGKPIFYSAGNFIFEQPRVHMEPESMLVQLFLGDLMEVSIVPLFIDERGLPELATGELADRVLSLLTEFSEPFGTRFERRGDRARLMLSS